MAWWNFWSRRGRRTETSQVFPGSVLKVVFMQGEDGYVVAECPQLPGCMSQGKTKSEAQRNIVDAIQSVLAVRMGQIVHENHCEEFSYHESAYATEESFRVKWPELTSV